MSAQDPKTPQGASDKEAETPPPFALPEVVGVAMSPEAFARILQQSVEEMMERLDCSRLVALSHVSREGALSGVTTAGFSDETIRLLRLPVAEAPAAERAIRTGHVQVLSKPAAGLPTQLASAFTGEVVVVPLSLGGATLAVLIGQVKPGVAPRSAVWQQHAREMAARAALIVEWERVASAYQDELRLRQYNREVAAAILEGRPLPEIAELILDIITQRLRVERAALYLRDGEGAYQPVALRNLSIEFSQEITRLSYARPMMARAIATGLPYYVRNAQSDTRIDPQVRELLRRENITTILLAILHHGEAVRGVLVVNPEGERQFTPAELSVFQSFADQATLAVAMARQLDQQREMAVMEERQRLAAEMHDTVAQSLTGLVLEVETARSCLEAGDQETAAEVLAAAHAQAKQALEDTRRAVQGLFPAPLERLSPIEAIAEEVEQFEAQEGVAAQFVPTGEEQPLLPEQRAALLRIAQESLSNIRKHAHAHRVRVGLNYGAEEVILLVEDDGIGFDTTVRTTPDSQGGYGLFGMNERARALGGEALIESTPGWGTRVRVTLPYHPASALPPRAERPETPPVVTSDRVAPSEEIPTPIYAETRIDSIRVLIVDDHAVARQGIRSVLEANGDIVVIGEAADGEEAAEQARQLHPDVVLMDLQMPRVGGMEGLRRIHAEQPELAVVVLTTFQTDAAMVEALGAGARGFLLKDTDPADLIAAVRAASRGEALLSSPVADRLAALATGQAGKGATTASGLNERELEVLHLLAQGARNKEIAAQLFITAKTVEYHLSNIFVKLGVSNRTEAVREAIERGLVLPSK